MSETQMEVDVLTVKQMLADQSIVLIDCREDNEHETGTIASAKLMPMSRWLDLAPALDEYRGQQLVVYCHLGQRSLQVTQWLRNNGFPEAQSMAGGIDAWCREIGPVTP